MEYTREYWQPRIATNPNRFRKFNDSTDYVELINEPEAITQAGTAFTAARLNNMESGITGAVAGVNEIQGVLDFTTAVAPFSGLSQTSRLWQGMTTLGNDIYACVAFDYIYKQTGGVGDFIALEQTPRLWQGMTTLGNDIYACVYEGDIYKRTNGTGGFFALGQTSRLWQDMTTLGDDVYACVEGGDIYKQTNGTGDFIALEQTSRRWYGMTTLGDDVYACVYNGDIYKQTGGEGDFIALSQASRPWNGITTLGNDVYACVDTGDIYKQTGGVGDFIALGQTSRYWRGMTTLGDDIYVCVYDGDIYTATVLTGNTYRASSSFSLPAMPDGARKRILNTHATTAITVTAYSGTTIEGQATMTLSAGHEVELELIGTDWRKFVLSQIDVITGSCTTNGTTNNTLALPGIVSALALEVGDVIQISGSTGGLNDKLFTVESITDDDSIIVNYEHAGNRGNGSLKLADQYATVTIKRIAKWHNAPIGLGQEWVNTKGVRTNNTYHTNTTGRPVVIYSTTHTGGTIHYKTKEGAMVTMLETYSSISGIYGATAIVKQGDAVMNTKMISHLELR